MQTFVHTPLLPLVASLFEALIWEQQMSGSGDPLTLMMGSTTGSGTIDPFSVGFSQDSISNEFKDGGTIDDLAENLRTGQVNPQDIPSIRVVEQNGQLFTLDNRRLEAFRRAGVSIPYRMASPQEAAAERWKFTTRNGGTSIRIRGR